MDVEILTPKINEKLILSQLEKLNLSSLFQNFMDNLKKYIQKVVNDSVEKKILSLTKEDEYLTIAEACKMLKVSRETLNRWANKGLITKFYIFGNPRFSREELSSLFKTVEPVK